MRKDGAEAWLEGFVPARDRGDVLDARPGSAPDARDTDPEPVEWMTMTQEEFSRRFKNSPIKRTKRRGRFRNVAVSPGNWVRRKRSPRSPPR